VAVFAIARSKIAALREHPFISGISYGLLVYAVMNVVVLPLSAAKPRRSFPI
jgi:hypothetical protein